MPFDKPLSEVVEGAAEDIRVNGWAQGFMFADDGSRCILGAMEASGYYCADILTRDVFADVAPLVQYFPEAGEYARDWISITHWNDKVATSQVEVEDKLMEIAKDLRNQGK